MVRFRRGLTRENRGEEALIEQRERVGAFDEVPVLGVRFPSPLCFTSSVQRSGRCWDVRWVDMRTDKVVEIRFERQVPWTEVTS